MIKKIIKTPYKLRNKREGLTSLNGSSLNGSGSISNNTGSLLENYISYDANNDVISINKTVISNGDIIAYAETDINIPTIFDNLPIAGYNNLGIVQVGSNLTVDSNGVISVNSQAINPVLGFSNNILSVNGSSVNLSSLSADLSNYYTKESINVLLNNKANLGGDGTIDFSVKNLFIYGKVNHWVADVITITDARLQLNNKQNDVTVSSGIDIFDGTNVITSLSYGINGKWNIDNNEIITSNNIGSQTVNQSNISTDSLKLGGILSNNYYHTGNCNNTVTNWTAFDYLGSNGGSLIKAVGNIVRIANSSVSSMVELYNNNQLKLSTTNEGCSITGNLITTSNITTKGITSKGGTIVFNTRGLNSFDITNADSSFPVRGRLNIGIAEGDANYHSLATNGDVIIRKLGGAEDGTGGRLILCTGLNKDTNPLSSIYLNASQSADGGLTIHNNGYVRIGNYSTTQPTNQLEVVGNITSSNEVIALTLKGNLFKDYGSGGGEIVKFRMADNDWGRIYAGTNGSNNGYLEIATADDASEPIYVRQYLGEFSNLQRTLTLLDSSGNSHFPNSITAQGEITAYSDKRLKSNIKPLKVRGELKPVTYIKDNKESIGFIAQEVKELYPELVKEDDSGYLSLNYSQMVAVLYAEIADLKNEITILKGGSNVTKY